MKETSIRENLTSIRGRPLKKSDNCMSFVGIRGIQAGREYYTVMCPLKMIPKIFLFDEEELSAELRAQRTLNKARIPELAKYLCDNQKSYIFSSITASIDGDARFEPFAEAGDASDAGRLQIPMTARFLINDGQHRRAAIEQALREYPELGDESISVVFFIDGGLKRSQQMFADLNRHAIRPTKSLGILYDRRDPLSQLACRLATDVTVFRNMTDMERTSIPNRSNKLHTLSSIYQATQTLLGKKKKCRISAEEESLAIDFWEAVGKSMPDWQLASAKKASCAELRKEYIHSHGIALQAIAIAGAALLADQPRGWKRRLKDLSKVDWSRSNESDWDGRALVRGRVSKARDHVQLTANLLKTALGLKLSTTEQKLENRLAKERKSAA